MKFIGHLILIFYFLYSNTLYSKSTLFIFKFNKYICDFLILCCQVKYNFRSNTKNQRLSIKFIKYLLQFLKNI